MMFNVGPWELAIVLSKALSYLGFASFAGGVFVLWLGDRVRFDSLDINQSRAGLAPTVAWSSLARRRLVNVLLLASVVGVIAVILFYLLQVGVINQMGVAGMFDAGMISLLAQSSVGYGAGLKLAAFAVAGFAVLSSRSVLLSPAARLPKLLIGGWLLATMLFAASFVVLGHIAELGFLPRLAIIGHIVVVGLWTGSLYPLHLLSGTESSTCVRPLLRLFGRAGWAIIAILLLSGVTLVLQVLGAVNELFSTPYGLQLLLKLLLVSSLLALAALNKFRLVPALADGRDGALRRSVALEMALAFFILLLTAAMTTVTGPAHLM